MQRYRIDLSYDGSQYSGWQIQPNGITVQQRLQEGIAELSSEDIRVHGSGRTDRGVHARNQVAHFDLENPMKQMALRRGLNAILPPDIRVLKVRYAPARFHARRSAIGKEYRYFIWNDDTLPPYERLYHGHVRRPLDVERMRKAASYLQGRHDFAAFTANPNRVVVSTVRSLTRLDIRQRGKVVVITARGEGFLYKMVRSLAGFLVRVGEGHLAPSRARTILSSRTRTALVPTAAPEGLFLWRVSYPRFRFGYRPRTSEQV